MNGDDAFLTPSTRAGLRFREVGSGPTLVFVHGLAVSSRYWVPLMTELAANFHCVAPDLPGHGLSADPEAALNVRCDAEALAAFLESTGHCAALVANSLGCQVVAALLDGDPAPCERVVLVGPTVDPSTRDWFWSTAARASLCEPLSLLPILLHDYLRFGMCRFRATYRKALYDDIEQRLARIHQPALVIGGERDHIATTAWCRSVAAQLPNGRFELVSGGAHAVHYSHPKVVGALITRFMLPF